MDRIGFTIAKGDKLLDLLTSFHSADMMSPLLISLS
jgi:hypothetical protein